MNRISRRAFLRGSAPVVVGAMTPGAVAWFCKWFDSQKWWDFRGDNRPAWVEFDGQQYWDMLARDVESITPVSLWYADERFMVGGAVYDAWQDVPARKPEYITYKPIKEDA